MSREGSNPSPSLYEVNKMKEVILDEAIDQMVEIILHLEEIENKKPSKKRR